MADIAPLGFAVDTTALAEAAKVAEDTAVKISGVADAADKVGEASDKSATKVKTATDAHKEHTKALAEHADALTNLKQKTDDVGTSSLQSAQQELAARQRIATMVDASLAKLQQANSLAQSSSFLGATVPKDVAAMQFEHGIEQKAFNSMGPTEADIARQAEAAKQMMAFRKELQTLTATVDPAQAKLMKLSLTTENLGRMFDAGKINQAEYNAYLAKIDAAETNITTVRPRANHHTPIGEAMRSFTYGIPRFGREGRRLINEEETPGIGMVGLLGGALGGLVAIDAIRQIASFATKLPGDLAKATDEFNQMTDKARALGTVGIAAITSSAEQLHAKLSEVSSLLVTMATTFDRVSINPTGQNALLHTLMDAGALSGQTDAESTKSVQQVVGLLNQASIDSKTINEMFKALPQSIDLAAKGLNVSSDDLRAMAANGHLTGQMLVDGLVRAQGAADALAHKHAETQDQLANDYANKMEETYHRLDQAWGASGFVRWWDDFKLNSASWATNFLLAMSGKDAGPQSTSSMIGTNIGTGALAGLLGAGNPVAGALVMSYFGEGSGGSSTPVPNAASAAPRQPTQLDGFVDQLNRAVTSGQGTYGSGNALASANADLAKYNTLLADAQAHMKELSPEQQKQVETLRLLAETAKEAALSQFGKLQQQIDDVTEAFGQGHGNSGLIGVWQQAIQMQRQMSKDGHDFQESLGGIVNKLLQVKQALQSIADADELKKLKDGFASSDAQLGFRPGSYDAALSAHNVDMSNWLRDRQQMAPGGDTGGGAPLSVTAGSGRTGFNRFGSDAYNYFKGKYGETVAQGIAAGITAEGGSLGMAHNGAFGIGQWRGSRQAGLMRATGTVDPSELQQFQYLDMELRGGDAGGHAVLGAQGASGVLQAYISKFMRPGPGTRADMQRGLAALGLRATGGISASGGGASPDLTNQLYSAKDQQFFTEWNTKSLNSVGALVGYNSVNAFMDDGKSVGGAGLTQGAIGKTEDLIKLYQARGNPAQIHALELEQKINEAMANAAPAYREALKVAMQRQDANDQALKVEQELVQLRQQAADNSRRGDVALTGDPKQMAALELQLKIEEVRRQPIPQRQQDDKIAALNADAASSSQLSIDGFIGSQMRQTKALYDQLNLLKSAGDERGTALKVQQAQEFIDDHSNGLAADKVQLLKQQVAAIIEANDHLKDQVDKVQAIHDAFAYTTQTISTGWANMFADFERHGVLHTSTLLRSIEDGFYGMLDRIYQKMVISPLMKVLDGLLNRLANGIGNMLLGGGGGMDFGGLNSAMGGGDSGTFGQISGGGGADFSALVPHALGDVVNRPTMFPFANGTGLMGEAGWEGILPLRRGPDGRLGVQASGGGGGGGDGGGTIVNVIDQRGAGAPAVEVQERQAGNGMRQLDIMVRDAQRNNISSGRVDADTRAAYGITRQPARR